MLIGLGRFEVAVLTVNFTVAVSPTWMTPGTTGRFVPLINVVAVNGMFVKPGPMSGTSVPFK